MSRRARSALLSTLLALAVSGCMYVRPALQPGPWDMYANSGTLRVYGVAHTSPGPRIFRALRRQPGLAPLLEAQGEPDTIEVVGDRLAPKQIILTYRRNDAGRPRRIVLVPSNAGYVAGAPELLRTERIIVRRDEPQAPARARTRSAVAVVEAAAVPPTAVQRLECPIDRRRADCRAFCVSGARYDWCR